MDEIDIAFDQCKNEKPVSRERKRRTIIKAISIFLFFTILIAIDKFK